MAAEIRFANRRHGQDPAAHLHHGLVLAVVAAITIGSGNVLNHVALFLLVLLIKVDLEGEDDHGDAQADQGRDEDPAQRSQGDALRVV